MGLFQDRQRHGDQDQRLRLFALRVSIMTRVVLMCADWMMREVHTQTEETSTQTPELHTRTQEAYIQTQGLHLQTPETTTTMHATLLMREPAMPTHVTPTQTQEQRSPPPEPTIAKHTVRPTPEPRTQTIETPTKTIETPTSTQSHHQIQHTPTHSKDPSKTPSKTPPRSHPRSSRCPKPRHRRLRARAGEVGGEAAC